MKQFSRRGKSNWFECGIYRARWLNRGPKKWTLYETRGDALMEIGKFTSFELMQRASLRHEVMSVMGLEKMAAESKRGK